MKTSLIVTIAMLTISTSAFAKENTSTDAAAVNTACAQEATTASCGSEKVGTGLLKCLHAYKKANKEFKFSDGCEAAMKTMHNDRKAK